MSNKKFIVIMLILLCGLLSEIAGIFYALGAGEDAFFVESSVSEVSDYALSD